MKIKVKCSTCKRDHLVTIPDEQPVMEIKTITCLSCGIVIKYRIGKAQTKENVNNKLKDVFGGEDLFNQLFGKR